MFDVHMPDHVAEARNVEAGSLSATVARLRQENRDLRDQIAAILPRLANAENLLARLRAGGKG